MDININVKFDIKNAPKILDSVKELTKEIYQLVQKLSVCEITGGEKLEPAQEEEVKDVEYEGQIKIEDVVPTTAVVHEYSRDEIARGMSNLMDAGKQDLVFSILKEFDATNLMEVDPKHYNAMATKLKMEGAI